MLIMDRDCKRGGERFAIPTQGEVQGKLTVLEIVAITCLREVLASKNAFAVAALKKKVLRAMKEQCAPFGLSSEDETSVLEYACEFFEEASKEAARQAATKVAAKSAGTARSRASGHG
ncbi:hypothetical protein [Rhizobium leguminosarum]|uniref:Uncharacterized protein n=1 Tax=Rhizobium leguminosarum TaxID=384 RepID=A0A4V2IJB9_RHILE|nr:hypothetical protein [Rhizobium leguminosarum]TAU84631.1 hypothetical protein ELI40_15875 [Rhizobium leguminosarum]TAV90468.1 hypothetical protein ELI22_15115 [Rhizobium leguminosarum]TAV95073.1 hypothetical protein ELI21_15270 [Rhizobium leguminosarum]TAW36151.1 hypothetical protein ELI23_15315 [Rhizobium leguminosarum]TAX10781.1 hypothetical protein ELI07_15390 [Rhizobium leguminosarum]